MVRILDEETTISPYKLKCFDTIIVYGAGRLGTYFLGWLIEHGIDRTRIVVYDRNYHNMDKKLGFSILKPCFSAPFNKDNTLIVVALKTGIDTSSIKEIKQKFFESGYQHITMAEDIYRKKIKRIFFRNFQDSIHGTVLYQDEMNFADFIPQVKAIAFYLPQFHEIPENDEWWGKGFTEWTNTKKAIPNFEGHYQPREPHDSIGYYDLSEVEAIRSQAEMAKRHGIFGWGIYYYWFSGKKLLTKPLDLIYENKDIDINYFLVWCNETWTKRWVGDEREILLDNDYSSDDPVKFIHDLAKYMVDDRYIRFNGKPVIMVYRVYDIPDVKNVVKQWRKYAEEIGIGEIFVISAMRPYSLKTLELEDVFDGESEFCPTDYAMNGIQLIDENDNPVSKYMYYYDSVINAHQQQIALGDNQAYQSCVCGFDNTPRYGRESNIYNLGFSMKSFYNMTRYIVDDALKYNKEYFFVFAWNEWAESANLEPDKKYGYAMLNTFSKAVFGLPFHWR